MHAAGGRIDELEQLMRSQNEDEVAVAAVIVIRRKKKEELD